MCSDLEPVKASIQVHSAINKARNGASPCVHFTCVAPLLNRIACAKMAFEHERALSFIYDMVLFTRPDVWWGRPLPPIDALNTAFSEAISSGSLASLKTLYVDDGRLGTEHPALEAACKPRNIRIV